jgi:hypothetical protein
VGATPPHIKTMSKKKFKSFKANLKRNLKNADKMWDKVDDIHGVIHKQNWDFISVVNTMTHHNLDEIWIDNLHKNVKSGMLKKHKMLVDDCVGLGKNKAVVGVGSGPSFNKNCYDLQYFLNKDGVRNWENRRYITICSNHQFKPLLNMGIIPDFVLLVDASDVVYDQLTKDIPSHGKSSILIAGLHCSPKVIETWSEQGREIRFILNTANETKEAYQKLTNKNPGGYSVELGGNVINGAWTIGITKFHSNVFIGVANDLSYKLFDDVEEQRKNYYSDKDYSTNAKVTGTGRDEAARQKRWAGFEIKRRNIWTNSKDKYDIKLDLVGTSHTLWVYKNWLEMTLMRQVKHKGNSFHYFNCTEGGVLGVMSRCGDSMNKEQMSNKENWYLLDDVCRFYHTAILKDVFEHFEKCREVFDNQCIGNQIDALNVEDTARIGLEAIAPGVDLNEYIRKNRIAPSIQNISEANL